MPRSPRYNPIVLTSKTVFLQRIQEAITDGYRYYVAGSISFPKATGLVRKFKEYYFVHLDKNSRYRRKAAGLGNARLILYHSGEEEIDLLLMVTPGEHPAHQLEKLRDVRSKPLVYREFELVMLTLKGRSKPGMTWRLSAETMSAWRERLHLYTVHYNKLELTRAWYSLYRVPGFAGIRRQVGELVAFWRKEWKQYRREDPCPMSYPHNDLQYRSRPGIVKGEDGRYWTKTGFPSSGQLPKLFYVRKQSDIGSTLSQVVRAGETGGPFQTLFETAAAKRERRVTP
jgi:hypothetical protein